MVPFDPPGNIRKHLVFQGGESSKQNIKIKCVNMLETEINPEKLIVLILFPKEGSTDR